MAAKKKPKAKAKPIPRTAAQKAAESALYAQQQVTVESQAARAKQAARGFGGSRQLRAGGTSLMGYNLERFKSDPFPTITAGGGGSSGPGPAATAGRPSAPRSGAKANDGATQVGKQRAKAQAKAKAENRLKSNPSGVNNAEKMAAQAAAKAKAQAAAKAKAAAAKKKKQQKLTDSKGGTTKALGTKAVLS